MAGVFILFVSILLIEVLFKILDFLDFALKVLERRKWYSEISENT